MKIREAIQEPIITYLLKLCQEELDLEELPPINIIDDQSAITANNRHSFGVFDGKSINVISKNRHLLDVCRTLAHELTHWKQKLEGQELDGNDGSETENQANATAGVIMRKFGEKYPECFTSSLP